MSIIKKITNNAFIVFVLAVGIIKVIDLVISLPIFLSIFSFLVIFAISFFVVKKRLFILKKISICVLKINSMNKWKLLILLAIVSMVTKLIALAIVSVDARFVNIDIWVYEQSAKEIAQSGKIQTYAAYAYNFPHLMWFSVFLSPVEFFFEGNQIAYCVFFIFITVASQIFIFLSMTKLTSNFRAMLLLVVTTIFPSQMLLPQFITHEIPAFFFVAFSMWLFFCVVHNAKNVMFRIGAYVVIWFSLLCGVLLNSATIVFCIALTLYVVFYQRNEKTNSFQRRRIVNVFKKIVVAFLIMSSVLLSTVISKHAKREFLNYESDRQPMSSIQWTLYVGANVATNAGFSVEDVHKFAWPVDIGLFELNSTNVENNQYYQLDDKELSQYRNSLIKERYKTVVSNPKSFMKLLTTKFGKIWSYFNYPFVAIKALYPEKTVYNTAFDICISFESVIQILLIVCLLYAMIKKKMVCSNEHSLIFLYVLGITFLLMLTECNSKYTIPLQTMFWMLCMTPFDIKFKEKQF